MAGRGRAKSRDDITCLMYVIDCGEDSVPLQKDTELYAMSNLQQVLDFTRDLTGLPHPLCHQ